MQHVVLHPLLCTEAVERFSVLFDMWCRTFQCLQRRSLKQAELALATPQDIIQFGPNRGCSVAP